MKKNIVYSLILLITTNSLVQSQTLDDVLKKHFEAIGQEKLIASNAWKVSGRTIQGSIEFPWVQMTKRPGLFRLEVTFQGLSLIQTYNGKEGWMLNQFEGSTVPQPASDDQMKSMRYSSDIDGMLWNWKEKGYSVTFEGNEDMEGTSCYKLKLVTTDGDSFTYYIDSDSFMLLRTNSKIKIQGNDNESDNYYGNYMRIEGIAVPGKYDSRVKDQIIVTVITDKVDINVQLEDSLFDKPTK